ncbi:MAG TPA: hypothetical protein IAB32_04965 [Candidatus Scatosoma pullicola]|nr:hypothetical protein [Candidatus Scatosoma pullicola]
MKKTLFLNVVMVLTLFFLDGCFLDKAHYFSYDELKNNAEKVEIVEVPTDSQSIIILKSLDEEESDLILKELSEIRYTYIWNDPPDIPSGICLRLYNIDGTVDLIGIYGTTIDRVHCSETEFMEMIERFLDSEQEAKAFQKN